MLVYGAFFLVIGLAIWAIVSRRVELAAALRELNLLAVSGAVLFGFLAIFATFGSWLAAITDGGVDLPVREGLRIYGVGQIGKYLPGSVWPVLTQAQLGRRHGISSLRMASGALLALAIGVCVALVMGCVLLPFSGAQATAQLWWAPILAAPMVVVLFPAVLNRLIALAARMMRRGPVDLVFTVAGVARSAAWSVAGNLLFGLHIWCLGYPLGATGLPGYLLSTCAYALASGVGVLIIFAPAGAGAREAVLAAVLAPLLSLDAALVIALVSRVVLIVVDVFLALSQLRGLRRPVALTED